MIQRNVFVSFSKKYGAICETKKKPHEFYNIFTIKKMPSHFQYATTTIKLRTSISKYFELEFGQMHFIKNYVHKHI